MNAPIAHPYLVLLLDETGPLDSFWQSAPLSPDAILGIARTMFLKRDFSTVLHMEWAEKPLVGLGREFHITIPGTHELPPPPKKRAKRAPEPKRDWHASAGDVADRYDWRNDSGLRGIVARDRRGEAAAPVANHCGIAFTQGGFDELPLLGARDWDEGFTRLHETRRACRCGAELVVITKRLLGGK